MRIGLRAKLIIALLTVTLLAVAIGTLYSSVGLQARIDSAAHARAANSATHFAGVAAAIYSDSGGWTRGAVSAVRHVADIEGLRLTLRDATGKLLESPPPGPPVENGATSGGSIVVGGKKTGSFTIAPLNGQLLTPEELQLRRELNQLNIIAGAIAAVIALLVALYLAFTLSRPLRRIRAAAEEMQAGNLSARVDPGGDEEIRAVGQALNRLAETLQDEEALRKENLADLAHELRTPVMGILARIEAAQDGVMPDEAANLEAIHAETQRLVHLLDDLSALSEAERPGLLLAKGSLDLATVARAQADAMRARFDDKGVELREDLEPVWVEGDRKRLEQVVANLLSNALRYTEPDGRVFVHTAADNGSALLSVTDTGIGIPQTDVPHLFTRFWRGEKSRSRDTGGAGIGLAIVKELVRAHGGTVEVESVPGQGSRFSIHLPTAPDRQIAAPL